MLNQDKTEIRKARHHMTQEDFTPPGIVEQMCSYFSEDLYKDFSKTVCDPCCGIGNILCFVIEKRLQYCKSQEDKVKAISTIYGVELMQDNVDECKERIYELVGKTSEMEKIVNHNIVCSDFFKWDFENWRPIPEAKSIELF